MARLKLYQKTNKGSFITLAGVGIMIDFLHQAIDKTNIDPNEVVIKVIDGLPMSTINVMYPTPHTILFERMHIANGKLTFTLGGGANWSIKNDNKVNILLSNPEIVQEIVNAINLRAKTHRRTKLAMSQ